MFHLRQATGPEVATVLADLVTTFIGVDLPVGVVAWDGSTAGPAEGPAVLVRSRRTLRRLLWNPDELGLARAYVAGDLDINGDLTDALRRCRALTRGTTARPPRTIADRLALLRSALRLGAIGPRPAPPAEEARPVGRLHTPGRDRRVIAHHYDLGNEFYQTLLDPAMAYSCAYFTDPHQSLAQAQHAKLDLICRKLDLRPGQRLLDVGCGWGSLILHAAQHHGVHATGVTLSAQQAALIRDRIDQRGLTGRVTVRHQDYREITGDPFHAVASVEMGEHVGAAQYPRYAAILYQMLRPGGRLLLQQMSRGPIAPGGGAFIESYIAPDMTMTTLGATLDHLEHAGLEIRDVHVLREHYTRTIRAWEHTLNTKADQLAAIAGDGQLRVWRLYLAGVALAFEQNRMGVNQILATRTTLEGASGTPATRSTW